MDRYTFEHTTSHLSVGGNGRNVNNKIDRASPKAGYYLWFPCGFPVVSPSFYRRFTVGVLIASLWGIGDKFSFDLLTKAS